MYGVITLTFQVTWPFDSRTGHFLFASSFSESFFR